MTIRAYFFFAEERRKIPFFAGVNEKKILYRLTYRIKLYRYYTVCIYVPYLYTDYTITYHYCTLGGLRVRPDLNFCVCRFPPYFRCFIHIYTCSWVRSPYLKNFPPKCKTLISPHIDHGAEEEYKSTDRLWIYLNLMIYYWSLVLSYLVRSLVVFDLYY